MGISTVTLLGMCPNKNSLLVLKDTNARMLISAWYSESELEAARENLSKGRGPSNVVDADFGLRLSAKEWSKPEPHSSSVKTSCFLLSLVGDPSLLPKLVALLIWGRAENRARCPPPSMVLSP